jgi:hypothetical protein
MEDDGVGWLPAGVSPGIGRIENRQCSLIGSGSSVSLSGNGLTATYQIEFKTTIFGMKTIWTKAYSVSSGKGSNWESKLQGADLKWLVD